MGEIIKVSSDMKEYKAVRRMMERAAQKVIGCLDEIEDKPKESNEIVFSLVMAVSYMVESSTTAEEKEGLKELVISQITDDRALAATKEGIDNLMVVSLIKEMLNND